MDKDFQISVISRADRELMMENIDIFQLKAKEKTLRDEFAMAAVTGLTTATDPDGKWFFDAKDVATEAYLIADAMLKAREVKS
jgi:hypothetical protein